MAGQEGIEEIKTRLSNIRSVEPILGAMRTISLGSWQAALKRKGLVLEYTERLLALLPWLAPMLEVRRRRRRQGTKGSSSLSISVVAIGTQRGLCGAFNSSLIRYAEAELERLQAHGGQNVQVELCALGARITRMLEYQEHTVARSWPLPMSALPTNELANELTHAWLGRYEARELDAVYLIYNTYRNSTLYEPVTVRLIPPPIPSSPEASEPWSKPYGSIRGFAQSPRLGGGLRPRGRGLEQFSDRYYVDTDPMSLCTRLVVLWATAEVYRILLDSAAAEHSARYQLMEGAAQNSSRLIDELTLALQSARQHAITSEMQELAVGAGLLGSQEA